MKRVAVIGGGIAGLTASLSLRERGVTSVIIERGMTLGGLCGELGCKGDRTCVRCDACLAREKATEVSSCPEIESIKEAEVVSLTGAPGDFRVTVEGPGLNGGRRTVRAGAVICATGAEPFDAGLDRRLGHGEVQDVLTSMELERGMMSTGAINVPSTGTPPRSVAFIQCVGSRDERFHAPYCSGYCCKSSFKQAQAIRAKVPTCSLAFLFMDWRLYDPKENVRLWASGQEGVEMVRSRPSEVIVAEDGRPEVRFSSEGDADVRSRAFDLVVLALGLRPSSGAAQLARILGIETDGCGFMRSLTEDPCSSTRAGIFLAGSCRGPKDILESAKEGATAASRALAFLEVGE